MQQSLFYLALIILGITICSCTNTATEATTLKFQKEIDLNEYGINLKVKGPEDVKVDKKEGMLPHEIEITGTDYHVWIYGQKATESDRKTLKKRELLDIKENQGHSFKLIKDEDFGFIYAKQFEGDTTKYHDFVYVLLKGDQQFKFISSAVAKAYTEKEIEAMLDAVRQEPRPAPKK